MQMNTTHRQQSLHTIARGSDSRLSTWLMTLSVCGLLLGAGSAAVANGQSGEEEFQRKMDELKRRGTQSKPPGEKRPPTPASSGAEMPSVPGGIRNKNIGATPGTCQQNYDRFRDTTAFDLVVGTIYEMKDASTQKINRADNKSAAVEELRLALAATTTGNQPATTPPQYVDWYFQSTASDHRYHNEAEVLTVIDGERVKLGNAYSLGGSAIFSNVEEHLRMRVPAKLFLRVARAREVEVRIGTNDFRLEVAALKAMREFASCTGLK